MVVSAYGHTAVLAEVLGGLAVAFEVVFPIPQMRKILVTGSSVGVRYGLPERRRAQTRRSCSVPLYFSPLRRAYPRWEMVATWWVGDVLKTAYFVISEAPLQFFLCGLLQMMLDTVLAGQLVLYYRSDPTPAAPDAVTKASPLALVKLPTIPSLATTDSRRSLAGVGHASHGAQLTGFCGTRWGGGLSAAKHG